MGGSEPASSGGSGGVGGAPAGGSAGQNVGGAAGSGGAESTSGMSSGCGTEPGIASNQYNNGQPIAITAANMERRYILRVPDDYDNTKPYKLIIAWHQLDGNDVQMYANDYYHLEPLSGGNAIFAAPNGQKNGSPCTTTGNGDGGCGWPNPNGADVALGDAVVNELKENFCIDENRIFATGWSYGGSMSYKHACERGLGGTKDGVEGYVRGIAVYSGAQLSGQCSPSVPVAYYGSHGTGDTVLGYDGGVGLAQNFANANGCDWSTPERATGNHVCTDVSGCSDGYPTKFCSFNGGHTPDPSDGGGGSWQYQLVWDFFDQF
jgi:poly(3-hydroxybutyrate) depolymerase